jgi:hypoxanthine phosphoribosyltransferase
MEIALKYLEKQLEENKASEETLNLIKNLNKDLQSKIKDTGYYAENKKIEDRITNLPGMTNKLKKLKSSN